MLLIDYDPEDILEPLNDQNDVSEDENDLDDSGARDHYVSVGKSKLRNEQPLLDDPRYAGKRTSRKDIFFDDEEDMKEYKGLSDSEAEENDDSNDDDEDLLAKADNYSEEESSNDEQDDEEAASGSGEEAEESDQDAEKEGDDRINAELRRIQEEEKYVLGFAFYISIYHSLTLESI